MKIEINWWAVKDYLIGISMMVLGVTLGILLAELVTPFNRSLCLIDPNNGIVVCADSLTMEHIQELLNQ